MSRGGGARRGLPAASNARSCGRGERRGRQPAPPLGGVAGGRATTGASCPPTATGRKPQPTSAGAGEAVTGLSTVAGRAGAPHGPEGSAAAASKAAASPPTAAGGATHAPPTAAAVGGGGSSAAPDDRPPAAPTSSGSDAGGTAPPLCTAGGRGSEGRSAASGVCSCDVRRAVGPCTRNAIDKRGSAARRAMGASRPPRPSRQRRWRPRPRRRPRLNFDHPRRGSLSPAAARGPECTSGGKRRRKHKPRLQRPSPPAAVPVYEALRAALPRWLRMGVSPWVLDTVENGVKLVWTLTPTPFGSAEYPLAPADKTFMTNEIQRELEAGYILEVTQQDALDELVCVSSAFVTNQAKKPRKVLDYSHVNDFQELSSCKYETLPELAQSLRPGDALLSWDVKDAYHHLKIREEDRKYLAFKALGRTFVPVTMPFGMRIAPFTWTKVMRPVVQHLRELGFRILAYVDDFGGAPPAPDGQPATRAQARAAYNLVEQLFGELGLKLHPTKGVKDGPTRLRLLGHVIDTLMERFILPDDRVDTIVGQASTLSRRATAHRRWVSFRQLRVFCGTAVSTTLSVPSARYHLRSLFTALQHRHPSSGDARLGRQALKDLLWWTQLQANAATGRAIWPGAATMLLDTDASGVGWGGVLDGIEARGHHGVDRNGLHINCLELGAVTLCLRSFRNLIPAGSVIRLRTDSMVALGVMRAGSSRSPILMQQMRDLHELVEEVQVDLRVEHVSSVLNDWADRLSREHDSTDWTLDAVTFTSLDTAYGPHSIDLFACDTTARCPRFFSRWMCPGTLATNAMTQDWTGENAWANPPFHLMGAVISKVIRTGATVTLIAPVWRAQLWWQRAVDGCAEWHLLPVTAGVPPHVSPSQQARKPFWRTAVFLFAPNHV
eukprot:TRINITY_DN662_c0_g1_i10.p1 TRINITY_DN662_c0_g1~~TRINITY_DN662_c0_g1_i10.p1  ORF type:complete len:892 (+),score=165.22 TRINITY_DN662_c0_g1_i10:970-3645(+)